MRKIDVAHETENQRETTCYKEIETSERDAIEDRAHESLLSLKQRVEPIRPNAKDHPQDDGPNKKPQPRPDLARSRQVC